MNTKITTAIIILVLLALGTWAVFGVEEVSQPQTFSPEIENSKLKQFLESEGFTITEVELPDTDIDTSEWQTYTNELMGISFKMPQDWVTGVEPDRWLEGGIGIMLGKPDGRPKASYGLSSLVVYRQDNMPNFERLKEVGLNKMLVSKINNTLIFQSSDEGVSSLYVEIENKIIRFSHEAEVVFSIAKTLKVLKPSQ